MKSIVWVRFSQLLNGIEHADNIKVFVKQEAHKAKKLEAGDVRLISAVSLLDTLIDRVLLGWLNRAVLNNVGRTPCLVGWSPVKGGWIQLNERFRNKPVVCMDRSAWDWTVKGYLVEMWLDVIINLAVGAPSWWVDMVRLRFRLLFTKAVFQFEDGTVVEQAVKGIMKSGCFLTIILNSLSQSLIHYLAMHRIGKQMSYCEPYTIGDDTVQDGFPEIVEYARQTELLGPTLKGVKIRHFVEFAGFAFDGKVCWPAYWQKHLFNMAHSADIKGTVQSYQYLYVHEPEMYDFIVKVARELGPECVLPKIEALSIMDGILD